MALGTKQYMSKLAVWLTAFKSHASATSLKDESLLKHSNQPHSYLVKINQVSGLKAPGDLAAQSNL